MNFIRIIQLIVAFTIILSMGSLMIKRKSNESVSLIWIVIAVVALFQATFPQALDMLCEWLHIDSPPILALMVLTVCLIVISFYLSIEVSVAQNKVRELAMHISLLNKEVSELKEFVRQEIAEHAEKDKK